MDYRKIPGVEKEISQLVLGCMLFSPDEATWSYAMLDSFFAAGGNALDTAYSYAGGDSERLIGMWMKKRKNRSAVFLIDKGGHPHAAVPRPRIAPEELEHDIRESLIRLQTDYIDLYLLHRDDPRIPASTVIDCLNQEIGAGRIRAIGASNWEHERVQEANEYAEKCGMKGFVVSSNNISLAVPMEPMWAGVVSVSEAAWRWHKETQFPLMPWSSQARGFFSGHFTPENRENPDMVRVYYNDANFERLRRAQLLGKKKGCSAIQISLAYVLGQPFPTFPIVGPVKLEELSSCLDALEIQLSPDEMRWLNLEIEDNNL
ncbi:MAG: aldo/keto reductase [Candidatus Poribacteria bacterium]|nr:aldo/keto reductase [Candidatus Poribacteria bacterium]